jgi:hypothetical protein
VPEVVPLISSATMLAALIALLAFLDLPAARPERKARRLGGVRTGPARLEARLGAPADVMTVTVRP